MHAKFDKRLAEEEAWLRQGIKARRTRNEGRVRALAGDAGGTRGTPRSQIGIVRLQTEIGARSGQMVFEADGSRSRSTGDRSSRTSRRG